VGSLLSTDLLLLACALGSVLGSGSELGLGVDFVEIRTTPSSLSTFSHCKHHRPLSTRRTHSLSAPSLALEKLFSLSLSLSLSLSSSLAL
jgi:hypothetical protein